MNVKTLDAEFVASIPESAPGELPDESSGPPLETKQVDPYDRDGAKE